MNDRNLPEYHELFQKMDGDVILKCVLPVGMI